MSEVKISEYADAPEEGTGKTIHLEHPFTFIQYDIALFRAEGKFYAITDKCEVCGGSLGGGWLQGLFAICRKDECKWHIRKGWCKFDRSSVLPTYKVLEQDDGIYIVI